MSIGSVYNIVHENENSDDAPPAKRCRSGPKSVFDEATAVLVLEMIEDRSELTLAQIVDGRLSFGLTKLSFRYQL